MVSLSILMNPTVKSFVSFISISKYLMDGIVCIFQ